MKIAVRETGNRITATLDRDNRYFLSSLYSVYPKQEAEKHSIYYILGILNSALATYYLKAIALDLTRGAFAKFRTNQLARLPSDRYAFPIATRRRCTPSSAVWLSRCSC